MKLSKLASAGFGLLLGLGVLTVGTEEAEAATNFQMPFPCGQTWQGQTRSGHSPQNAVDLNRANDYGDTVVASASGTVSRVANEGNTSYGRWIEIDHGGGWTTRYAHLSVQRVPVGENVAQGETIGDVGNSGGSTGSHLHFEERYNGSAQRIDWNGSRIHYFGSRDYTSRNCGGGGNPYTAGEVCGDGYEQIDSHALGSAARIHLMYNSSNGKNCVVTLKTSDIGTATSTSAFLEVAGGSRSTDSGNYGYYAGPVREYAPGTCVQWGGSAGSESYTSPFEHCG
ncbi:Peptidase family M23 [Actinopolyspora mzabensis]|uniref:Peptidase family M23 n=1 Tax=Actinopolyspora mzabensis TaxID=995066 RepID=A0A1G9EKH8_ACTMZ|nr:M23 family metallopeptidase [Actinopolyspora mzabensis]SDK76583.1 Peptidase family M23 [Actinopolyspora mzabensis]